jgi:hypothetical protein
MATVEIMEPLLITADQVAALPPGFGSYRLAPQKRGQAAKARRGGRLGQVEQRADAKVDRRGLPCRAASPKWQGKKVMSWRACSSVENDGTPRFRNVDGNWEKELGFTDKAATMQLATKREHEADLVRKGSDGASAGSS